jgi:putative N6-adenine-specific DNA methylase
MPSPDGIRPFEYQRKPRYFAQIAGSMEDLGAQELSELGARSITPAYRGLYFEADKATLYRINYTSRLLTRVLAPLTTFSCHSPRVLYKKAKETAWDHLFRAHETFAVHATVTHSKISHSQYAALCVKDAIADYFREKADQRPAVDRTEPNVRIRVYMDRNRATLSLDTSGGSLHRRRYGGNRLEAPMQETVAAAVVRLAAWEGATPLYDPMCGSGTLLGEALMSFSRIPAGYLRDTFGFERLPDFDPVLWHAVKHEARHQIRELPEGLIAGSDVSPRAIQAARANLDKLPYGDRIALEVKDFQALRSLHNTTILCNPPYGIRLGQEEALKDLYKKLGDFLKHRCKNATAYLYCGNRNLIGSIELKPSWKKPLMSGGLDGRLVKYEIY